MTQRFTFWMWVVILAVTLTLSCRSEDSMRSGSSPGSCIGCSIEHELVVTLGAASGEAALLEPLRISEDASGRFWIFAWGAMPVAFGGDGAFIRTVGARGQGPGEMSAPARLWLVPGDTVGILDGTTLHVWGPELEFERREAIPVLGAREAVVIQWPSEVVVNALDPSPGRREYPLHVVDLPGAGAVLSSHGGDPEPISSSSLYTRHPRSLSAAGDGGYWSAAADSWEIVSYTRDHEVAFTLSRQPEWFPERSDLSTGTFERPPSPQCKGSSEDAAGLIWMFCLVASPEYQLAYRDSSPRVTGSDEIVEARGVDVEYHRLFHTWIEAYDPEGGEIIARSLFEDAVLSVLPGGKAAFRDASERGDPLVRIHQFAVSKPSH